MMIHARQGDRALALRAYQRCTTSCASELDVEPDAETLRVYEEIGG